MILNTFILTKETITTFCITVTISKLTMRYIFSALSWGNTTTGDPGVDYNEQFRWEEAGAIQDWYKKGLVKGLPYPLLSVAEHFAAEHEGFDWGAKYRAAGYTTSTLLW